MIFITLLTLLPCKLAWGIGCGMCICQLNWMCTLYTDKQTSCLPVENMVAYSINPKSVHFSAAISGTVLHVLILQARLDESVSGCSFYYAALASGQSGHVHCFSK